MAWTRASSHLPISSYCLPIFASAIVGGLGSPPGAIAGGFVIAFSEVTITYAWKKVLNYLGAEPEGLVQLLSTDYKIRGQLCDPGDRAAVPAHRPVQGQIGMSANLKNTALFLIVSGLILATGFMQSWNSAILILNMGLVSAVMAAGQ